jgi:4'-phosphopantetheinyl transferase
VIIYKENLGVPSPSFVLPRDEIHVWRVSLDEAVPCIGDFRGLLSEEEKCRADKFYFERDRERFIAGRGLLRVLLGRYLAMDPRQLDFDYNDYGKPEISHVHGDSALRFNGSHSGALLMYAFARAREVGIDVEYIRPIADAEQILERFCSEREKADFREVPENLKERAFLTCWTRKEAYLKARGDGLTRALDGFSVSLIPGQPATLMRGQVDSEDGTQWSLQELLPGNGYVAALAAEGRDWVLVSESLLSVERDLLNRDRRIR